MNKIVIWLFWVCFTSCTSKDILFYNSSIQKYRENIVENGAVLIVPGAGCSGCISGIEDFVNNNYNSYSDVTYIFTNIKSRKLLKLKMPRVDFISSSKIIIDKDNIFYDMNNENKIYPCVLLLEGYNVDSVFYISPTQNVTIKELLFKYKIKD